jgi:hypothetical protein
MSIVITPQDFQFVLTDEQRDWIKNRCGDSGLDWQEATEIRIEDECMHVLMKSPGSTSNYPKGE